MIFSNNFVESKLVLMPLKKLNNWSVSGAIGHTLRAKNIRCMVTAANRLHGEGGPLALVAPCSDTGLKHVFSL